MKALTVGIIMLAWVQTAWAGHITLTTTTVCFVDQNGLVADLTIKNEGDEPAEALEVTVSCRDATWETPGQTRLAPGAETAFRATLQPTIGIPGTYAALVRVKYRDRGGVLYTALSHGLFEYKSPGSSYAVAYGESQEIRADRPFILVVTNADMVPHRFQVRLVVPSEIGPAEPARTIDLEPGGKAHLAYRLDDLSAPAGAFYNAQAFIDYEHDGLHHGDAMDIPMIVRDIPPFFIRYRIWLLGLAGLMILGAVYLEWAHVKRRSEN